MNATHRLCLFLTLSLSASVRTFSADPPPKAPVPPSPYIGVVYKYADTMLASGRDTLGPQKTGLFLSVLDRKTPGPLTARPPAPPGVHEMERAGAKEGPLAGYNLQHSQNLLRLLYTLSDLSSKPVYRDAADGALKCFLQNTFSFPVQSWDRVFAWDTLTDAPVDRKTPVRLNFFRSWMLWDRCFDVAPDPSSQITAGLVDDGTESSDEVGYLIRARAAAYAHTKDGRFLKDITRLADRMEKRVGVTIAAARVSFATDCDGASRRVPEPFAARLRALAAREDEAFCALPHDPRGTGGFIPIIKPNGTAANAPPTALWQERDSTRTTAAVALMCLARYENAGSTAYRDLVIAAADSYLNSPSPENADLWPLTFGHAISLQVAAWRHTSRQVYLDRARHLADLAVEKFWGDSALPRASLKSEHYESITGADTLALALAELHLNILHITAVRCPPNTIDR